MTKKLTLLILLSACLMQANAQKSLGVGFKLLNEIVLDGGTFYPGAGGQLVYRMSKHSGLETGLYYSNQTITYYVSTISNYYPFSIAESWLMLPILYRYDSKLVNFTVGPQIDYFLGWKNKHKNPSVIINDYSRTSARFAVSGGISKSITLSQKWLLEPEARLKFYPSEELSTIGLNIAVRRKLF